MNTQLYERTRKRACKSNDRFVEVLCGKMAKAGFYQADLAERLKITPAALSYKLKDPEKFKFWEIKAIFRILKYSPEDIERSFRQ